MLWLILGILLLIIAIGRGVIVHPIILLAIAAIVMFLMNRRYA